MDPRPDLDPPATVARLIGRYPVLAPPVSTAGAAVTIVLRAGREDAEVLLIERSRNEVDPASGHVALPGGRVDEGDGNLLATALRELEEEVGLTQEDLAGPLRFVGAEHARRFGLTVGIFAGELAGGARGPSARSASEVAHVFWFPGHRLAATETIRTATGPVPSGVPASVYEGHVLWGFTRRILRAFFGLPAEPDLGGRAFAAAAASARGTGTSDRSGDGGFTG